MHRVARPMVIGSLLGVIILLTGSTLLARSESASLVLPWWTVDGGGGTLSNGNYSLSGTIGQADAGAALEEGAYTLVGGYWYGARTELGRYELYLPSVIR
jgi:hypothetical protein